MKIPTPSFFRIRLTVLIIGFVVLCFLVGLTKDLFAENYTFQKSPVSDQQPIFARIDYQGLFLNLEKGQENESK